MTAATITKLPTIAERIAQVLAAQPQPPHCPGENLGPELPRYTFRTYFFVPVVIDVDVHAETPEDAMHTAIDRARCGYFPARISWDYAGPVYLRDGVGPLGAVDIPERFTPKLETVSPNQVPATITKR